MNWVDLWGPYNSLQHLQTCIIGGRSCIEKEAKMSTGCENERMWWRRWGGVQVVKGGRSLHLGRGERCCEGAWCTVGIHLLWLILAVLWSWLMTHQSLQLLGTQRTWCLPQRPNGLPLPEDRASCPTPQEQLALEYTLGVGGCSDSFTFIDHCFVGRKDKRKNTTEANYRVWGRPTECLTKTWLWS